MLSPVSIWHDRELYIGLGAMVLLLYTYQVHWTGGYKNIPFSIWVEIDLN